MKPQDRTAEINRIINLPYIYVEAKQAELEFQSALKVLKITKEQISVETIENNAETILSGYINPEFNTYKVYEKEHGDACEAARRVGRAKALLKKSLKMPFFYTKPKNSSAEIDRIIGLPDITFNADEYNCALALKVLQINIEGIISLDKVELEQIKKNLLNAINQSKDNPLFESAVGKIQMATDILKYILLDRPGISLAIFRLKNNEKKLLAKYVDPTNASVLSDLFLKPQFEQLGKLLIENVQLIAEIFKNKDCMVYPVEIRPAAFYYELEQNIRAFIINLDEAMAREKPKIMQIIQNIRNYLFNIAGGYESLLLFAKSSPELVNCLQQLEDFLRRDYSTEELARSIQDRETFKFLEYYQDLEKRIKVLMFGLQYKSLIAKACQLYGWQEESEWAEDVKLPTTFLEFAREVTGDCDYSVGSESQLGDLLPLFNEFLAEQPKLIGEFLLCVKHLRFAYKENDEKTKQVNDFLNKYINYFMSFSGTSLKNYIIDVNPSQDFRRKTDAYRASLDDVTYELFIKLEHTYELLLSKLNFRFMFRSRSTIATDSDLYLRVIKNKLQYVINQLTDYTQKHSSRFPFFNIHKNSILEKARAAANELRQITDLNEIKQQILVCIDNKMLEGTGDNSFRSKLLQIFVGDFDSKSFRTKLEELKNKWPLPNTLSLEN